MNIEKLTADEAAQAIATMPERAWSSLSRSAVDALIEKALEIHPYFVFSFSPERAVALGEEKLKRLAARAAWMPTPAYQALVAIRPETAGVLPHEVILMLAEKVADDQWCSAWAFRDISVEVIKRLPHDVVLALAHSAARAIKETRFTRGENPRLFQEIKEEVVQALPPDALAVLLKGAQHGGGRLVPYISNDQAAALDDFTVEKLVLDHHRVW